MPNQYSKVPLKVITEIPKNNKIFTDNYTRALAKLLISKMPRDPKLIDEIIKKLKEEL